MEDDLVLTGKTDGIRSRRILSTAETILELAMYRGEGSRKPDHEPFISPFESFEQSSLAPLKSIRRFRHSHDVLHCCQEACVLAGHLPTSRTPISADNATEILDGGG
jgi:hypothetical protein